MCLRPRRGRYSPQRSRRPTEFANHASGGNFDVPLAAGGHPRIALFSHFQRSLGRRGGGGRCAPRPCRVAAAIWPASRSVSRIRRSRRDVSSSPRAQHTRGRPTAVADTLARKARHKSAFKGRRGCIISKGRKEHIRSRLHRDTQSRPHRAPAGCSRRAFRPVDGRCRRHGDGGGHQRSALADRAAAHGVSEPQLTA